MKRYVFLIASALVLMAGATFAEADGEYKILIVDGGYSEIGAPVLNMPMAFTAPEVLVIEAPQPGILEVLPEGVIERPHPKVMFQNRAPTESPHRR